MANSDSWDYSVDVLVVGSGNGALSAALCSYEMGTKDVLVVEKGERFGGRGGGGGELVGASSAFFLSAKGFALASRPRSLRRSCTLPSRPRDMWPISSKKTLPKK